MLHISQQTVQQRQHLTRKEEARRDAQVDKDASHGKSVSQVEVVHIAFEFEPSGLGNVEQCYKDIAQCIEPEQLESPPWTGESPIPKMEPERNPSHMTPKKAV